MHWDCIVLISHRLYRMTALHQVVLLTFFTSFVCFICTEAEEPWVMVKEMGHIGYQIKSVKEIKQNPDGEESTFVSLIQAPIPATAENGEDLKLVSTQEDGLSAVYEITTVNSDISEYPTYSLTSKTEKLQVELNHLTGTEGEQTDFEFNDFQLQVEKRDQAESTTYKMTIRDCEGICYFSTKIGKNTTSGFEEIRDYDDRRKYVKRGPFYGTEGNDKICSIQVNRAALRQDGVEIRSLTFLNDCEAQNLRENFIYMATYGLNLI